MRWNSRVLGIVAAVGQIGCIVAIATAPVMALEESPNYKPGDRVEVQWGPDWQPGVVVSVDGRSKLIEVRLDDDKKLPADLPADLRKTALTRHTFPDEVRRQQGKAAKQPNGVPQARTWKDRTGKFSITGTLKEVRDGNKLVLERSDGKLIEVPLEKLSDEDGKFVRAQIDAGSPFATAGDAAPSSPEAAKRLPPILREMQVLRTRTFPAWSFQPDSKFATAAANPNRQSVALDDIPGSQRFFESVEGMYVAPDGRRAIVDRILGRVARDNPRYLEVVDLAAGKSLGLVAMPPETALLDASPADGLIVYRSDGFGVGTKGLLTIAKLEGKTIVPKVSWGPFERERNPLSKDIAGAWILPRDRVMTMSEFGKALVVWDISNAKALVKIPAESSGYWSRIGRGTALSADRRLLALPIDKAIALIDLDSCSQVAAIPLEERSFHHLALRDDNRQLCGFAQEGMTIWDLTTGEQVCTSWHPRMIGPGDIRFAGQFVLMEDMYLFDLPRRIMLWEYERPKRRLALTNLQGGRLWGVSDPKEEGPVTIVSAPVPNESAARLAGQLGTAEELTVAKPGDPVAIKMDVDSDIAAPDDVRAAIAANLEKAGFRVVDRADLVVTATCRSKATQTIRVYTGDAKPEVRFRPQFRPKPEDIVERTITPHASFLLVSFRGEKIWEDGYLAQPSHTIYLKENESLDEALTRLTRPNVDLLKKTQFPAYITRRGKASDNGAFGASKFALDD